LFKESGTGLRGNLSNYKVKQKLFLEDAVSRRMRRADERRKGNSGNISGVLSS